MSRFEHIAKIIVCAFSAFFSVILDQELDFIISRLLIEGLYRTELQDMSSLQEKSHWSNIGLWMTQ